MTKLLPVPTSPADVAALLHEAIVYGRAACGLPVVGRRRPHIPHGTDPADVNRECARRYAVEHVWSLVGEGVVDRFDITEVDPADVVPFVDVAALLEAADVRANAAQRTNVKGGPK